MRQTCCLGPLLSSIRQEIFPSLTHCYTLFNSCTRTYTLKHSRKHTRLNLHSHTLLDTHTHVLLDTRAHTQTRTPSLAHARYRSQTHTSLAVMHTNVISNTHHLVLFSAKLYCYLLLTPPMFTPHNEKEVELSGHFWLLSV